MSSMGLVDGLVLRLRSVSQPGRHAVYKVAELLSGHAFLSRPGQTAWRAHMNRHHVGGMTGVRTAMIAHVYYPELLDEVLACWRGFPGGAALHLTVPRQKAGELRARLGGARGVVVHEVENRGRDIAPFLAVLGTGALDGYDAVLKLHTKRSPHLWNGDLRRRMLFAMLAGHQAQVTRVQSIFADPRIGLAGWRTMWRTRLDYWHDNEATVRQLMDRMAPGSVADLAFFEGSMFWFRPAALEPLRRLGLTAADFEAEAGQTDGALHHAVERCFGLAVRAAGYRCADLQGRTVL